MRIFMGAVFVLAIMGIIRAVGLMPEFPSPEYWGLYASVVVLWISLCVLVPGKEED